MSYWVKMTNSRWMDVCFLVACLSASLSICRAQCNFPQEWGDRAWMESRTDFANNRLSLLNYRETYYFTSASQKPNEETVRFSCDAFEVVDSDHVVYIRSHGVGDLIVKRCISNRFTGGVILQRDTNETISIESCRNSLDSINTHRVLLPVSLGNKDYTVDLSMNCPFPNIPYYVTYQIKEREECVGDLSSSSNVQKSSIYLLACNYQSYSRVPLTGSWECLTNFSATNLGETNEDNGEVFLFRWRTATQPSAFIYCARYHNYDNKTSVMSVDITSLGDVSCQQNANFNLFDTYEDRDYVRIELEYSESLASTTPGVFSSSRVTPVFSTTTLKPQAPKYIQLALEGQLSNMTAVKIQLENTFKVNFEEPEISQNSDGLFFITVLIPNPTDVVIRDIRQATETGQFTIQDIPVKENSFLAWRESDPCPESYCGDGGTCSVTLGYQRCLCPDGFVGEDCSRSLDGVSAINVQFGPNLPYTDSLGETFVDEIQQRVADIAGIQQSQITDVRFDPSQSNMTVVTFVLTNPTTGSITRISDAVATREMRLTADGSTILALPDSFYMWQDDDSCPDSVCQNDGVCWLLQGTYSCACAEGYGGPKCETEQGATTSVEPDNTVLIVSVVVVVIVLVVVGVVLVVVYMRRKKKVGSPSRSTSNSEAGYGSSTDDPDRELYNTMNKGKATAYHEKSFTNKEETANGELTGIHKL